MIELAAPLPINAAALRADPVPISGAGATETLAFGNVLAETVDAAGLAFPSFEVLQPGFRAEAERQMDGKILPDGLPHRDEAPVPCKPERLRAIATGDSASRFAKARPAPIGATPATLPEDSTPKDKAQPGPAIGAAPDDSGREPPTLAPEAIVRLAGPSLLLATESALDEPRRSASGTAPRLSPPLAAAPVSLPDSSIDAREFETAPPGEPDVRVPARAGAQVPLEGVAVAVGTQPQAGRQARLISLAAFEPSLAAISGRSSTEPREAQQTSTPDPSQSSPGPRRGASVAAAVAAAAAHGIATPVGPKAPSVQPVAPPAAPAAPGKAVGEPADGGVAPLPPEMPWTAVLPQPAPAIAANLAAAPAPALAEPHRDFAALIDRLIDSRNALSPAPVQTALTHADFGEITVRFAHDAAGLNVALSSADPGFAPAVQAAMPAERSDPGGEDRVRGQPGQGQSPAPAMADHRGAGHPSPQSRTSERNPQSGPGALPDADEGEPPRRRSGVFA